jgi:hypothetical protein
MNRVADRSAFPRIYSLGASSDRASQSHAMTRAMLPFESQLSCKVTTEVPACARANQWGFCAGSALIGLIAGHC